MLTRWRCSSRESQSIENDQWNQFRKRKSPRKSSETENWAHGLVFPLCRWAAILSKEFSWLFFFFNRHDMFTTCDATQHAFAQWTSRANLRPSHTLMEGQIPGWGRRGRRNRETLKDVIITRVHSLSTRRRGDDESTGSAPSLNFFFLRRRHGPEKQFAQL